jgi:hypothetical protein
MPGFRLVPAACAPLQVLKQRAGRDRAAVGARLRRSAQDSLEACEGQHVFGYGVGEVRPPFAQGAQPAGTVEVFAFGLLCVAKGLVEGQLPGHDAMGERFGIAKDGASDREASFTYRLSSATELGVHPALCRSLQLTQSTGNIVLALAPGA